MDFRKRRYAQVHKITRKNQLGEERLDSWLKGDQVCKFVWSPSTSCPGFKSSTSCLGFNSSGFQSSGIGGRKACKRLKSTRGRNFLISKEGKASNHPSPVSLRILGKHPSYHRSPMISPEKMWLLHFV